MRLESSVARRRQRAAAPAASRRGRSFSTLSPALVSLPGAAGTARRERGRAAERHRLRAAATDGGGGGGEDEAAVVVGALVGVGERGVGGVDADEVLGGGVRGGVRVDGEREAAELAAAAAWSGAATAAEEEEKEAERGGGAWGRGEGGGDEAAGELGRKARKLGDSAGRGEIMAAALLLVE
nr:unnamed protein product [Digitaria exilis]